MARNGEYWRSTPRGVGDHTPQANHRFGSVRIVPIRIVPMAGHTTDLHIERSSRPFAPFASATLAYGVLLCCAALRAYPLIFSGALHPASPISSNYHNSSEPLGA